MNIQDIVAILTNSGIEPNEANVEVKMLIEHFCNYGVKDIIMGHPLDYEKLKIVEEKAKLRASTKLPIQYIIGSAYFMGNMYYVSSDVLIPRDETELVVRHAIDLVNEFGYKKILDIGTGTGCIACSIAQNCPSVEVVAVDISKKALCIAQQNAKALNISSIEFVHSDLFNNVGFCFDLIISNPPYIPPSMELQKEVTFEPRCALFTTDENGVEFYEKIIKESPQRLVKGGSVVFELGIGQAKIVQQIFEQNGFSNIVVEKDFTGIERIISARLN